MSCNSLRTVPTSSCVFATQTRMVSSQSCWVVTQLWMVSTRFWMLASQFWMVSNISKIGTYLPWKVATSSWMVSTSQNRSRPIFQGLATIQRTVGTIRSVQNTYTNWLAAIRTRVTSSFSTFSSVPEPFSSIQNEVGTIRGRFRTLQKELRTIRGMVGTIQERSVPSRIGRDHQKGS